MATDIQDWTTAVNITGGSVAIAGTATVTISGIASVSITGQPTVILGAGTASVGSISAIGSTVTVAGTINIGNVPAVTISGTPTVNINSGSVSITGQPVVNVQAANGVNIYGPNLMPVGTAGPITAAWADAGTGITTVTFHTAGYLTVTATATSANGVDVQPFSGTTGPFSLRPVNAGQRYHVEADWFAQVRDDQARVFVTFYDGNLTQSGQTFGGFISSPVGVWVTPSLDVTVPGGSYWMQVTVGSSACINGDTFLLGRVLLAILGSFSINAQQGSLPATIKVNVVDSEAVVIGFLAAQSVVDFAAVVGRSYVVQTFTASWFGNGTQAAGGMTVGVYNGLNTLVANLLWGSMLSITAANGDKDRLHATDLGIIVPVGAATRIGFAGGVAGTFQAIAAGVYLQ